jgi:hypothetical protein
MDLANYPGTTKRVTLDSETLVPVGVEGDEKYMLSASTSAYSDNTARKAIQSLYIAGGKVGWTKSSGFKGSNGKFALDSSNYQLGVKLDATVSGTSDGYYVIDLAHEDGVALKGETIAADIQAKVRALECNATDIGYQLAYTNCSVKFSDNKFFIASGTISDFYTGPLRSSAAVGGSPANDCASLLGFDQQVTSYMLASANDIIEAPLTANYTTTSTTVAVGLLSGISTGDAVCITDGVNTDYFITEGFSTPNITVSSTAISHDYTTASGAYIQVLKKTDPDNRTDSYVKDADELLRYMAKIIINQLDYSS